MQTINVLAKSSFSEIMELKFEMSLRNNRRSGIEDSKYRTDFSRFSTTKEAVADGEIEVKIVFWCLFLFVCLLAYFKMEEITKRKFDHIRKRGKCCCSKCLM